MKIQNVKGGYDFLPEEQKIRDYINSIITKNFKEFGYNSIETPILCYYDILADKYDENNDILKEIYKLSDQGDRSLGLRYDLTVPFAKFIALNKNNISFPFKRYEISKVFRDGPVKVGRDREFTQCDADVVGIKGQLIEVELLCLYAKTFKELGIDIYIKYNSRNLMNGLILESGVEEDLIPDVTTIIDKKDKITSDEYKEYLIELGLDNKKINKLIKLFDMSFEDIKEKYINTNNEYLLNGIKETDNLINYIDKLNLNNICIFDITLARGQNYYTGNVFEVYDKKRRVTGSIGGGGRYDNMVTNFINDGNEYPCVGISFGLSSIYEILKQNKTLEGSNTKVYIIPIETEIEALNLANILRNKDISVEVEMNNKKLKKALDYANKSKIKYVIILGEDEIKSNTVTIKNMFDSTSKTININDIESMNML